MKKTLASVAPTTASASSSSSSSSTASQTATIIKNLLQSNNSADNQSSITAISEQIDAKRFDELRRIFSKLQATSELCLAPNHSNNVVKNDSNDKVKEKWNNWLKKQHATFVNQLSLSIQDGRKSSVRTFMGVIASSPIVNDNYVKENTKVERINPNLLQKLIFSIMNQSNDDDIVPEYMLEMLDVEYISKYRDVQYYTLTSIKRLAQQLYEQLHKIHKMKKDNKKDNKEDEENDTDEEVIGIHAENLLRILLKIQIADDQDDLKPVDVKADNGTCANYLFLPPSSHYIHDSRTGVDDDYDDGDDYDVYENKEEYDESDEDEDDNDSNEDKGKNTGSTNSDNINNSSKKKKSKLSPVESMNQHRLALQEATLAILKLPLPPRSLKLILQHFPSQILPNTPNPLRFADFCTQAYDMGGVTSLLALNSLFILMTQCGLEYKQFYPSLYNLVEPKVFYAKYRTRFFKLLIKCLSSNHMLPAYLIAAFCKKLCRCALNAPPSGALFVLALVSNLLRKHEECACIIHRKGQNDDGSMVDHYNVDEKDPAKSRAIESSLWELNALEQHYHPAVSSMAKGCGMESSQMLMHNLDEFLLHTYKSLFDQERKRAGNKRKSKVPLTFHEPKGLFIENDTFDGIFDFPIKKQKVE